TELCQGRVTPFFLCLPSKTNRFRVPGIDVPTVVRVNTYILIVESIPFEEVDLLVLDGPQCRIDAFGEIVGKSGPIARNGLGVARIDIPAVVRVHSDVLVPLEEVNLRVLVAPQCCIDAIREVCRKTRPVAGDGLRVPGLDIPTGVRVDADVLTAFEEVDPLVLFTPQSGV